MTVPPRPSDDSRRLEALRSYGVLDTGPEEAFDRLTRRAASLFDAPFSLISLIDEHRQWTKSRHGLGGQKSEIARDLAFCAYTILMDEPLVIADAASDERFRCNPLVNSEPRIRFYAGAPLVTSDGFRIGSLCVLGPEARPMPDAGKLEALRELALEAMEQLDHVKARKDLEELNRKLAERNRQMEAQQERLRQAELWAELALESGRIGHWQRNLETGAVFWSSHTYDLLGHPRSEPPLSIKEFTQRVHPEDRRALITAQSAHDQNNPAPDREYRVFLPDGSLRWFATRGKILFAEDGSPRIYSGVLWDITESRSAAEQLRKSEELFRALNVACPVGIFRATFKGSVEYLNPRAEQICGLLEGEALGSGYQRCIHPQDRKRPMRCYYKALSRGREFQTDLRLLLPDGSLRWVHLRAVPLSRTPGEPRYAVGTIEDVTFSYLDAEDLRQAKDAAEKADRAKSDFLANMSHEIRTPLNGVLATISLLLDTPLTPEQRELVEIAESSSKALLRLLSYILDLSKAEMGMLTIERMPFDVVRTVHECVDVFRPKIAEKRLTVAISCEKLPREFVGDSTRVRQIVLNFLSNAVKFTERGAIHVTVSCPAGESSVRIAVSDTGIGIPADAQDCLFVRFAQADTSSTRRFGGSGLGLAISKQLAELMGGSVGFESTAAKGSTFWIDLPVSVPESLAA